MFKAALLTIAKVWKQLKCPSKSEWIKKMCCVCIYIQVISIKKNKILTFAAT